MSLAKAMADDDDDDVRQLNAAWGWHNFRLSPLNAKLENKTNLPLIYFWACQISYIIGGLPFSALGQFEFLAEEFSFRSKIVRNIRPAAVAINHQSLSLLMQNDLQALESELLEQLVC